MFARASPLRRRLVQQDIGYFLPFFFFFFAVFLPAASALGSGDFRPRLIRLTGSPPSLREIPAWLPKRRAIGATYSTIPPARRDLSRSISCGAAKGVRAPAFRRVTSGGGNIPEGVAGSQGDPRTSLVLIAEVSFGRREPTRGRRQSAVPRGREVRAGG
jgi:hypothetical protein